MGNATKHKIAIISPYLDTLGGGERFILTIAEYFSKKDDISIFWSDEKLKEKSKVKFDVNLNNVKIENIPPTSINLIKKLLGFDLLFYTTDGSLFFSPCSKNYLIIQSPAHLPQKTLKNSVKLLRFKIICYSEFVRNIIRQKLNKDAVVIPPPVATDKFKPLKKENIIISVGRFFPWLHSKKQDVLVSAFAEILKLSDLNNWRLILIGSVDRGGESYLRQIQKISKGLPIEIINNASIDELAKYYGKAKIYWHATGFGEDLIRFPEKAEHFGITTVESMSAGCVPLVFAAGGQTEIIKDGKNGFLWETLPELIEKTRQMIINKDQYIRLSKQAQTDSGVYAKKEFIRKIQKLINEDDN